MNATLDRDTELAAAAIPFTWAFNRAGNEIGDYALDSTGIIWQRPASGPAHRIAALAEPMRGLSITIVAVRDAARRLALTAGTLLGVRRTAAEKRAARLRREIEHSRELSEIIEPA